MDCFFASVSARNRPELRSVPVAVAHSAHAAGHSEISCVNYAARAAGVRADMWMAAARAACPDLVVVPYEFEAYQEVSEARSFPHAMHPDIGESTGSEASKGASISGRPLNSLRRRAEMKLDLNLA